MPSVWFALQRSLTCKTQPSDVHDPKKIVRRITRRTNSDCCSRSNVNVKEVVNRRNMSKRNMHEPQESVAEGNDGPINPIVHEVVRNNHSYEVLRIRNGSGRSIGTLVPGTPGPGERMSRSVSDTSTSLNKSLGKSDSSGKFFLSSGFRKRRVNSYKSESHINVSAFPCRKCSEKFFKLQDVEEHHLSNHAVTELVEGESSRNIVQIICKSGLLNSNNLSCDIERILKVHNLQKTINKFEEYREKVKLKASEVSKENPRCLADGNELLRFHGTTTKCLLGINGSSRLCLSKSCGVCQILRHGFLSDENEVDDCAELFTASSSEKALASVNMVDSNNSNSRKALIVCRVIAGMVHIPLENTEQTDNQLEFDSLAGNEDLNSNIQELYLTNPRAILPCFVIICKPPNLIFS
ncbi:Dihydroflavonol-4-reductase-like [Heracleum sosnowskyi]|uniref:Dihydroflavonol-4-reductase-like n=1 Tax=Heracleum sosnowskyi TaxID=360622 RepID=A0AAD8I0H7_9APIA|nr:Dihydroflavonol-4-reductase-like [Heracleum sosnowskyi]